MVVASDALASSKACGGANLVDILNAAVFFTLTESQLIQTRLCTHNQQRFTVELEIKMPTVAAVACDAFATRGHDFCKPDSTLVFIREIVGHFVVAGKPIDVAAVHRGRDAMRVGLGSAAIIKLHLGLNIQLLSRIVGRRAASVLSLGSTDMVLVLSRATVIFLTLTDATSRSMGGGSRTTPGRLDLDFGIGFSLDRTFFAARRLTAATDFDIVPFDVGIDNDFFSRGETASAFVGFSLSIGFGAFVRAHCKQ